MTIFHFRANVRLKMSFIPIFLPSFLLYIKNNIKNELCTQKLVIAHISHNFLGQKCLTSVFQDGGWRHLGLQEIGGLTQKRPLNFEINYI